MSRHGPGPDPIDLHVGAQIRDRRIALDKNQSELGRALGLTFQPIEKYEKGTNRVSASMLFKAAAFLGCAPGDFFPAGDWQPAGTSAPLISRNGMGQVTRLLAGMTDARFSTARKVIAALAEEETARK